VLPENSLGQRVLIASIASSFLRHRLDRYLGSASGQADTAVALLLVFLFQKRLHLPAKMLGHVDTRVLETFYSVKKEGPSQHAEAELM
jgi:hypothetical protein